MLQWHGTFYLSLPSCYSHSVYFISISPTSHPHPTNILLTFHPHSYTFCTMNPWYISQFFRRMFVISDDILIYVIVTSFPLSFMFRNRITVWSSRVNSIKCTHTLVIIHTHGWNSTHTPSHTHTQTHTHNGGCSLNTVINKHWFR